MSESAKARTYLVPTEQSTLRTEFGKIYAIGPGRYEAYQSAIQIHARQGKDWHEIDAQFREKDGLFVSEGPVITVCCATSEPDSFITISDEKQRKLTLSLEEAQPVKPVIRCLGKADLEDRDDGEYAGNCAAVPVPWVCV